jgi:tetratricopeptide (TPR) repeat protein
MILRRIFRTKEGKIIAIIVAFAIVIISLFAIYGYLRNKSFMEQAVMAENYLNAGSYEQAVEAYQKVLSMKGSDKKLLTIGLAEAYAGLEDYDMALEILRSFYMKTPDIKVKEKIERITTQKTDYEYLQLISRAEVYYSNKEYEKAISEFEKAKQIKSKDTTSYKRIAEAYIVLGEYEKARDEIMEGQEITRDEKLKHTLVLVNSYLNKKQYEILMEQAAEYILQENYKDGEMKYQEAINLLPEESAAYIELANIYISQSRFDEAIRLLTDIYKYSEDQVLIDTYNQAKELKIAHDEKSNLLNSLSTALKKRNFDDVLTIMSSSFFIEKVVDDNPAYYNAGKEAPADSNIDVNKIIDGINLIIYDRYTIYYGDMLNSKKKGNGITITISGNNSEKDYSYYDGEWNRNLPNGLGRYVEIKLFTDDDGNMHENKTETEGSYVNALEEGNMIKYYYEDNREISRLSYQAKNGTPMPLPRSSIDPYPSLEDGYYVIGEIYKSDAPSGEYYSVKTDTIWGVSELIK